MTTQIYGIVGHPVAHSLSPAMQNAAFEAFGMDAGYRTFDVGPEELEAFLGGASGRGIAGLNVTIPHKIAAADYIVRKGELDPNAKKLGAVNTVKIAGGVLHGFNTDGPGFYRSLVADLKFEPEGRRVVVIGAGGAARAVVMYLGSGPEKISVFDIDSGKAGSLKDHYIRFYGAKSLAVLKEADLEKAIGESHLLVNATPVGMKEGDPSPIDRRFLKSGMYVYDLVYNRLETALVRDARLAKAHAVTGIGMLLYQGAIAFEIWTGRKAPLDVMKKALRAGLQREN
jgi:shikimate dehydrogenase